MRIFHGHRSGPSGLPPTEPTQATRWGHTHHGFPLIVVKDSRNTNPLSQPFLSVRFGGTNKHIPKPKLCNHEATAPQPRPPAPGSTTPRPVSTNLATLGPSGEWNPMVLSFGG